MVLSCFIFNIYYQQLPCWQCQNELCGRLLFLLLYGHACFLVLIISGFLLSHYIHSSYIQHRHSKYFQHFRFISLTSASLLLRCCTNILVIVTAVSGRVVISNVWARIYQARVLIRARVCVYIICPLLALTVFGCDFSPASCISSQAIELNIGVLFIFLVNVLIPFFDILELSF